MNQFYRAVRLSFRYRATLAASVFCALAVAVLWGGNISAIYPIVEVVFGGQAMPEWVDEQIVASRQKIEALETEIASLRDDRPREDLPSKLQKQINKLEMQLTAEQAALQRNRWLQPYIHRWMPTDPFQTLLAIIAALMIGTVVKDIFLVTSAVLVARLAQLATYDLRVDFYRRVMALDLASLSRESSGDMMNRFTADMKSVAEGIQTLYGRAIREPLKMVACLGGAAYVCWRLLVLSLVVAPLMAWGVRRLAKSLKRANHRAMEEMSQIYNTLAETFAGIKVVKAFTMERYENRRFRNTAKVYFDKAMKIARYDALVSPMTELMGITIISMAILAGGYLALNGETHLFGIRMSSRPLTLGSLLLFYGLLAGVSDPARKLSDVFNRLQQAAAASDRIYELLDRESKLAERPTAQKPVRHHRDIVFENVAFHYQSDQPVLSDINLTIHFGETIAIVGSNGCGKSTLTSLVPRFFDPTAGQVRIDGVDLRDLRLRGLRKQIGLVTQETLLFDDTVEHNIRYGAPHASRDQVIKAAQAAHADRFIRERLADGYATPVGASGRRLSGGQRQRIALARAILRDPAILILDEATSQIDLESEQLIHQVLEQFVRNRTTIIITHRLATLALADRIVVMDGGRILDVGTHAELSERCHFYQRLHQVDLKQSA